MNEGELSRGRLLIMHAAATVCLLSGLVATQPQSGVGRDWPQRMSDVSDDFQVLLACLVFIY